MTNTITKPTTSATVIPTFMRPIKKVNRNDIKTWVEVNYNYGSSTAHKTQPKWKQYIIVSEVDVSLPVIDYSFMGNQYIMVKLGRGVGLEVSKDGARVVGIQHHTWNLHKEWLIPKGVKTSDISYDITYKPQTKETFIADINDAIVNEQW